MRRARIAAAATTVLCGAVAATAAAHGPSSEAGRQAGQGFDGLLGPVTKLAAPKTFPTRGGPATNGAFSPPFSEPTIGDTRTDEKCLDGAGADGLKRCKPAGATVSVLPGGKLLYWNNLGGTENVKYSIVGEYGSVATNDEARVLDLGARNAKPTWSQPTPVDGGANPEGAAPGSTDGPLIPGTDTQETYNDGALFGAHESFLPDGKLLIQGGTRYSLDPGVQLPNLPGLPKAAGVVELTGLRNTRIFDPATNRFTQTGSTKFGRWYPTLLETGQGQYLNFSGVGKLIKPVYADRPQDSGQNVTQTERFDPADGSWSDEGTAAKRDLPLYPRMHLLPNGKAYYNAAGQAFNPSGQSVGEALWNIAATYDPKARRWTDLGIPATNTTTPGFRGSTSSTMLPLEPNRKGDYESASFLTAGGVLLPTPGSYFAVADSRITTVKAKAKGRETMSTKSTGPFSQPRWYGSNVLLPTGEVMAFSGADKDEVVGPGTEFPVQQAELFDPETRKWKPVATAKQPRTYHNTAVLLPSGEVLVGGHATISTLYLNNTTLPGGFAPHDGRDPSFEIYKPPYLFRGDRPRIARAAKTMKVGRRFDIRLARGTKASQVDSVRIARNTTVTHIVDADQRQVVLPVVARKGNRVTVQAPPDGNVAPPGPYMLFVNKKDRRGPLPSVAAQLTVAQ